MAVTPARVGDSLGTFEFFLLFFLYFSWMETIKCDLKFLIAVAMICIFRHRIDHFLQVLSTFIVFFSRLTNNRIFELLAYYSICKLII